MVGPLSDIQHQIGHYFPPQTHPYRRLERAIDLAVRPDYTILDIGCGRSAPNLTALRGRARKLYGIDVVDFNYDGEGLVLLNEDVANMHSIPNEAVDFAYSRSVMEHIEDAEAAFSEIARVLRPGGQYVFLTPNKYDYVSLIAAIVPNKLHGVIVRMVEGREEMDVFPTHYRANTFRDIRRLAQAHGFDILQLERLTQYPGYFKFSRPLFWLASQYERLLRNFAFLSPLRGWIFCKVVKR